MATRREFRVLVATDGSAAARAAVEGVVAFPWPAGTRVQGVVARSHTGLPPGSPPAFPAVWNREFERAAADARRALARRWPDAEVVIVDELPVQGILGQARRFRARAIVIGWRGHGAFRRLLMGSVSRGVVRHAQCPVLVVQRRPGAIRRLVVGLDGSANARRAAAFVAGLTRRRGSQVTLVRVVEPTVLRSTGLMPPSVRAVLRREVAAVNAEQRARARRELEKAAAELRRAGWAVRTTILDGAPLHNLLAVVKEAGAQLLVVGARGASGLERLLLGSVAEGALNHSPVPVLTVR